VTETVTNLIVAASKGYHPVAFTTTHVQATKLREELTARMRTLGVSLMWRNDGALWTSHTEPYGAVFRFDVGDTLGSLSVVGLGWCCLAAARWGRPC
jgi:hypothetical protein